MIIKDTENPENLRFGKEMIVKNTEKSGEFQAWRRNNCKKY